MRIRLLATASFMPLAFFAGDCFGETVITDTRTTPVATATINAGAPDDIFIDSDDGEITPTTSGAAVTVNSNNTVTNEGVISTEEVDGSVGILIQGGVTTSIDNSGSISLVDDFDESDEDNDVDNDGDLDGAFAEGSGRYGIRATGAGAITGTILNDVSGSIVIEGNDSWGISLESPLLGDLVTRGSISVLGDNARGVDVAANVDGTVEVSGSVTVQGVNAVAVTVDGDVAGALHIQGSVFATGYRYTSRPSDEDELAALDADDMLQGGPAVAVTSDIAGGILLDTAPTTVTDFDGDGVINDYDDDDDNDGIDDDDDDDDDNDGITDDDYDDDGTKNSSDKDDDNDGIEDDDSDDDGIYDTDDNGDGIPDDDLDQDGRADSSEGAASLVSYGGAPALLIGSDTRAMVIGAVGQGDEAYGLIVRGSIGAYGLFDGIGTTALKIGGDAGFSTVLTGGMQLDGSITATAYDADARAIHLASGADVDRIDSDGSITSVLITTSRALADETSASAVALQIDAGASTTSFNNSGSVSALAYGEANDAVAIRDVAGTLSSITNTGTITAAVVATDDEDDTDDDNEDADDETVTGQSIALDLRNAIGGVTIAQWSNAPDRDGDGVPDATDGDDDADGVIDSEDDDLDNDGVSNDEDDDDDGDDDGDGVADSQEAAIYGDVLLGAGDDVVSLYNGSLTGALSFGDGADSLIIGSATGIAQMTGDLTDSDGRLTIDVVNGELNVTNSEVIRATSLSLGSGSSLTFTASPGQDTVTRFEVTTASIADGAKLRLEFDDLIENPERYTVIHATGGLQVGDIAASLDGESPYIYVVSASADTVAGDVYLDVRKRTAAEMSLTQNQSLSYEAVYSALFADEDIRTSFLNAETREDFLDLYEQMLPDQGEGLFSTLDLLARTTARLTATRPGQGPFAGPDNFWVQEINTAVMREAGATAGSETQALGMIAGYEATGRDGGALGATLAFVTAEEKDDSAQAGEETDVTLLEAGVYWRRAAGAWTFNVRGAAGYAWLTGDRLFIDPDTDLVVQADSDWGGYTATASASVDYEARWRRYSLRPSLSVDYLYFSEGERDESGGGDGFDQTVQARTSSRLSTTAALTFGATYGREVWWRPEVRLGYRQTLAGGVGDTVFRFTGGEWVSLPATEAGDGAMLLGLSLKAGSALSYLALEAEYEAADGEDLYSLYLAGRMIF